MDYEVQWEVDDPANITVGRRDDLLNRCHVGVQGALDDKSREELDDPDILEQIQQECNALALLLSKDGVHITIAVRGVNSAADDADFVKRDYPQLLDLRIDGYEDMTVTEFREAVLNKMAKDEDTYLREIDRATRDNRFDRTRYSNADAAFVMNTLAPLTAERWQSWRYGGYFMEQAGMAEYQFTLTILDADSLTIREHTGVWQGMATAVGSALKNAPATLWQDEAGMENLLQTAADGILAAENRAVQVEMGYLSFLPEDNNDIIPDGTSTPPAGEGILDGATVKLYNEDPQYPYIHDIFTNNTNQTIIGWSSGMLAYDAQGNPLEVDWYEIDSSASSSYENIVEIEPNLASGYTIVPGDSYNVDGGWSIFGEVGPDGKTDVAFALFCFRDITFEDGTVWVNPAFDAWMAEHRGRQLDISYLESYYPATQSIA